MTERPSGERARSGGDVDEQPTTIGVVGHRTRWSVTPWGSVVEWGSDPRPTSVQPGGAGTDAAHDHAARDDAARDGAVHVDPDVLSAVPGRLDWYVAADDRWHVPADEPTVRQRRLGGVPVVETRIRIPDGDAVQRVWAVPDGGGVVVMEVENDSPLPMAVAFVGVGLLTERPPADVPVQGIDLPDEAIVMPVGHRSTVRVALPTVSAGGPGAGVTARRWPVMPPLDSVLNGWTGLLDRAGRLDLPDDALGEAVAAARADLLLEGPVDPADDPAGFLLDVGELVRCGDSADAWLPEMIDPAEQVARLLADASSRRRAPARGGLVRRLLRGQRGGLLGGGLGGGRRSPNAGDEPPDQGPPVDGASVDALDGEAPINETPINETPINETPLDDGVMLDALRALVRIAVAAGDDRAADDARRVVAEAVAHTSAGATGSTSPSSFAEIRRGRSVGRFVREVERRFVDVAAAADDPPDVGRVALLPGGVPTIWLGSDFAVHDLPADGDTTVSFAVRWHGARPAVLWERSGPSAELIAPVMSASWSATDASGEALWDEPPSASGARRAPISLSASPGTPEDTLPDTPAAGGTVENAGAGEFDAGNVDAENAEVHSSGVESSDVESDNSDRSGGVPGSFS